MGLAGCVRDNKEYKIWRDAVLVRDNYKCRLCNAKFLPDREKHKLIYSKGEIVGFRTIKIKGRRLHVHHIKRFELCESYEEANNISNGITLCEACHLKIKNKEEIVAPILLGIINSGCSGVLPTVGILSNKLPGEHFFQEYRHEQT